MEPVKKPFFSDKPQGERNAYYLLFILTAISAIFLILFWPQTRSMDLAVALHGLSSRFVEMFFRAVTFLGDDQFFMIFFSIIIWCVNKILGFWSAFMLLSSATYSNFIKDLTLLERPALEGVNHPEGSYAFPSGHTLTAVTVWPYMAVRLKKRGYWIWAAAAIVLIGFSRLVLGYHFLGDILGGIAFGIPFLCFFLWLSHLFYSKSWHERFSISLLITLAVVVPLFLTALLPGADPPKILGYLCGASLGYIIERNKIGMVEKAPFYKQIIKVMIGLAVLFGIIVGLGGVLPSSVVWLGFIRYALAGVWVTLFAPMVFVALKLSAGKSR
jgi:membrane-associated phospholipid phosphatase